MHGLLFTTDFLREGIRHTPGWDAAEQEFLAFRSAIGGVFRRLDNAAGLNEAQTEDDVIVPVLDALGWTDFVARQKVQSTSMNWFIVEQLPLIDPARYAEPLGTTTIGDFVREQVLRLSYTAHDLAGFARDLGYDGEPFLWDPEDRRHRMARLDALYFRLYGLDRDEAAYVLNTFPIVREQDERAFGRYRTRELVLGYMNALAVGDTSTILAL